MPRIQLTSEEHQELLGDDGEEPTHEMDDAEYIRRRDALVAQAQAEGDEARVDEILSKFPHPGLLASEERKTQARRETEAIRDARRPSTEEEQEAFARDLDAVPDSDKEGVRRVLAKYGMLAESDTG